MKHKEIWKRYPTWHFWKPKKRYYEIYLFIPFFAPGAKLHVEADWWDTLDEAVREKYVDFEFKAACLTVQRLRRLRNG